MADEAFASLKTAGDKWINERVDDAEDIVRKFTKGKTTLVSQTSINKNYVVFKNHCTRSQYVYFK